MQYFTFLNDDSAIVQDYTDDKTSSVFPATEKGIEALRVFAVHFTPRLEMVKNGKCNFYAFEAAEPIDLPFAMNLNYTDIRGADKLDDNNLSKAIQIMSQYDAGDIINSGSHYEEDEHGDWKEAESPWFAASMNHSREQLIYILSSIAKTLGQVIRSPSRGDGGDMEQQVLVTTPVRMIKVPPKEAIELLETDRENPLWDNPNVVGRIDPEEDPDSEGEFGMGGDWWKNPQEAIRRIARMIDEDLI